VGDDINNASMLEQIVYMPVAALFAPEMSSDPGFQAAESAAGVYIITSREMKAAQLANFHGYVLR
jgi:hypothetical protein